MPNKAIEIMGKSRSGEVLRGMCGDAAVQIRDIRDSDGRTFRVEFQSTPDGAHATARVLHNPWSRAGQGPNAGTAYVQSHVSPRGYVCVGEGATYTLKDSPHDLDFVVKRTEFWVTGFSFFKETGRFPGIEE